MIDEEKRDKGFKDLANAIVLQAVHDYREAILYNEPKLMTSCERFFQSKYCTFLSGLNGANLAEKLRSETLEFKERAFKNFDEKQKRGDTEPTKKAFKCPTCGKWVEVTFGYISKPARTRGYIANCKSCGLNIKRKLGGEEITRQRF